MDKGRLGGWNHADWKKALSWTTPKADVERMRRATRLGEPLGSDSFVQELEARAGRRLRVGAQGRPPAAKAGAAGAAQQSLLGS